MRQFSKVERFLHNLLLEKRYKRRDKKHINRQKLFLLGLAVSHPRSRDTHWQEDNFCHRRLGKENFKGLGKLCGAGLQELWNSSLFL